MAALKPAVALPLLGVDTSRIFPASKGLDTPELLVADSTKHLFPIYFCGEEVPVDEPRVARRWAQTLRTYGAQETFLYDLRSRASTFFHVIDPILRRHKIPRDFRFMPLAESALVNSSVSYKGASGYWQLMPETARELGLTVNGETDERYDLPKATVAVCHYLHKLYNQLGSWTLVAAAYNGGITHVRNKMEQQGHSNYYRLRLHRETSHYLFRILAFKELLSNPRQYSTLLQGSTIAQLMKPLPSWHKPLALPKKIKDAPTVELVDDEYAAPTWGPRPNTALTKTPSDTQQLIARAASIKVLPDAPDASLEKQGPHFPIRKLMMGLMVLRFRRPRFLQSKKGEGNRPLHFWDWL
ncbi:lytic transglycosylase domain-containing protein [Spirosoma validum]|uniref:Lytic transglycosylase domain-containing protein n=1 Tax=Spirosoma validum TaxID=2771355 RepID=A0A927GHD0_9BACT|nr:lytic transglycosylase domain-containing protein [Spirosoma validum]MBD2757809.1 lytic transglycosylase domain-containing protein [Spirosoma validum]